MVKTAIAMSVRLGRISIRVAILCVAIPPCVVSLESSSFGKSNWWSFVLGLRVVHDLTASSRPAVAATLTRVSRSAALYDPQVPGTNLHQDSSFATFRGANTCFCGKDACLRSHLREHGNFAWFDACDDPDHNPFSWFVRPAAVKSTREREISSPKVRGCRWRKKTCMNGTSLSVEFPSRVSGTCG